MVRDRQPGGGGGQTQLGRGSQAGGDSLPAASNQGGHLVHEALRGRWGYPELSEVITLGVDEDAKKRFGRGFAALGQNEQVIVVTDFSGQDAHRSEFENLKEWIVGAYYSSEQGMRELGWNGNYAFENYPRCEHGEH